MAGHGMSLQAIQVRPKNFYLTSASLLNKSLVDGARRSRPPRILIGPGTKISLRFERDAADAKLRVPLERAFRSQCEARQFHVVDGQPIVLCFDSHVEPAKPMSGQSPHYLTMNRYGKLSIVVDSETVWSVTSNASYGVDTSKPGANADPQVYQSFGIALPATIVDSPVGASPPVFFVRCRRPGPGKTSRAKWINWTIVRTRVA